MEILIPISILLNGAGIVISMVAFIINILNLAQKWGLDEKDRVVTAWFLFFNVITFAILIINIVTIATGTNAEPV